MGVNFKIFFLVLLTLNSSWLLAENYSPNDPKKTWISIGSDSVTAVKKELNEDFKVYSERNSISLIEVNTEDLPRISHLMHEKFDRCGGFMVHETMKEGKVALGDFDEGLIKSGFLNNYSISEEKTVQYVSSFLSESSIRDVILKLSSYHNRYYKSQMGVDAVKWIKSFWEGATKNRNDVKVELFHHKNFPQPSVILTFEGSESPDEMIVVGGHADSIAGFWNRENAKAPGADDNASGIAVISDVIKALVQGNYRPAKTIKFMAYAAEEVGLLGSADIAASFKRDDKNVLGVLQLDMTNFQSGEWDIALMADFTDQGQNQFLGQLIDRYVKVPWGYSRCGYGCSDHASWTKNGFSASIPFETKMELNNKNIHTAKDTIDIMGGRADHALKFAKLAVAYVIEMAK